MEQKLATNKRREFSPEALFTKWLFELDYSAECSRAPWESGVSMSLFSSPPALC